VQDQASGPIDFARRLDQRTYAARVAKLERSQLNMSVPRVATLPAINQRGPKPSIER
jgi:hypothetical protein